MARRAACVAALAIAWASLGACNDPSVDVGLEVTFPDRVDPLGPVPVDASGRFHVRVSVCVPDLPSSRANVVSLRELGDAGPVQRTVVLLQPATPPATCPDGFLSGDLRLPATGTTAALDVSALGARLDTEVELGPLPSGHVESITFAPLAVPTGGGIVEVDVHVSADTVDDTSVAVRTVPAVPVSTSAPSVHAGLATLSMSVPHDVAEVWVEAVIGTSAPVHAVVSTGP